MEGGGGHGNWILEDILDPTVSCVSIAALAGSQGLSEETLREAILTLETKVCVRVDAYVIHSLEHLDMLYTFY